MWVQVMDAKKIVKIQEQIRKIRSAVWQAHALETAVVLDLAELLADGPLSLAAVAERSGTHAPSLYRLLRALESDGFFSQVSPEVELCRILGDGGGQAAR